MTTIAVAEFNRDTATLLSRVEDGESLLIMRNGKPIARVLPAKKLQKGLPGWKRKAVRLKVNGFDLSKTIIESREDASLS